MSFYTVEVLRCTDGAHKHTKKFEFRRKTDAELLTAQFIYSIFTEKVTVSDNLGHKIEFEPRIGEADRRELRKQYLESTSGVAPEATQDGEKHPRYLPEWLLRKITRARYYSTVREQEGKHFKMYKGRIECYEEIFKDGNKPMRSDGAEWPPACIGFWKKDNGSWA